MGAGVGINDHTCGAMKAGPKSTEAERWAARCKAPEPEMPKQLKVGFSWTCGTCGAVHTLTAMGGGGMAPTPVAPPIAVTRVRTFPLPVKVWSSTNAVEQDEQHGEAPGDHPWGRR